MWSFFHGWRRKVGAVLLLAVLAIATSLWIRSFSVRETLLSFEFGNRHFTLFSHNGGVSIWEVRQRDWLVQRDSVTQSIVVAEPHFHYWFLALPLTIPAAYLILWKPRKRAEASPIY